MDTIIRHALGGTFDAIAVSGRTTASRHSIVQDRALGRKLWVRQMSTKGNTNISAPWHHRIAQQTRPEARGYSQFTSPLRWKSSPKRSFHSSKARKSQGTAGEGKGPAAEGKESIPEGSLSISQRLKKLSREYGWSAVGVYLALSVLDFPFCFLLVRTIGTDKIAELEHYVVSNVQKVIPEGVKQWWHDYRSALKEAGKEHLGEGVTKDVEMAGWGVAEADEKNKTEASLATQLALAYAIHKSFIFIRVPLTAAVTPKVVKVLRSWGWQIGKRPLKGAKDAAKAVKDAKR